MSKNNGIHERKVIELPSAKISELDDHIVRISYKELSDEIDLKEAKAHTAAIEKIRKGRPCHLLINFLQSTVNISNQARNYFAHNKAHSKLRLSQAIVIDGLAQKIVGNFYKNFHRPDCPVELFTNEEDAIKWIRSIS